MTRHTHTEDFTREHPRMTIRTAESLCDDIDAKLAAMPPRDEPTAEDWAEGFRDFVIFAVGAGIGALILQFAWSV